MRLKGLLLGDMRFQVKYGFYFLYTIITIVYIAILAFIPIKIKLKVSSILIFTDPATMGLFFMGAIVLLEKSQRVLSSLAVSPIKVWEYIFSKVVSLGLISTLVGVILGISSGMPHILLTAIGTFFGAVLFSLLGIIVATKVNSLNQFLIFTVPLMLFLMLPPLPELFGYTSPLFIFHAGNIVLNLIYGVTENPLVMLLVFITWLIALYYLAVKSTQKMLNSLGGVTL
ncbi:ABC transporter permease [Anaerocolumna sp. AGMB13020]|uniref:fluoroquinolone export ABC transporter permease subunit n=1 Tax=Anaerocolumna sp. AGMB13020 TaxID=3081750 RepID=UPI002952CFD2|nr:ABC transporter permease [Anaerocolumna sp. AGMB13020]WOO37671.1 ABC transporter permease [Anaerocolumna sp. AGMB13020]